MTTKRKPSAIRMVDLIEIHRARRDELLRDMNRSTNTAGAIIARASIWSGRTESRGNAMGDLLHFLASEERQARMDGGEL
jgi:hypothetical protein